MASGTIDEWLTQSALDRIATLDGSPQLREIIDTLVAVKARQLTFFEAQARDRLAASDTTRTVVQGQLRQAQWPIGAGAEAASETAFFFNYLFAGDAAAVAAIDAKISTLPGQEGLSLISRAVSAHRGSRA
jgi:hypothetical protein